MAQVLLRSVGSRFTTQVTTEHHAVIADEPEPTGDDLGPTPYELLLAGLGSCTSMTVFMYARRKAWPLEGIQIELRHDRVHADDCADCEAPEGRLDVIRRRIRLEGDLSDAQRARLLQIARKCPVHKTITSAPEILDEWM